jgi:hypothetical protein
VNLPPKPGEITACAVLLAMLDRYQNLQPTELIRLSRQRGLRGGALPLRAGVEILSATGLIAVDGSVTLSAAGRSCVELLDLGEEPTNRFRDLILALSLGTAAARAVFANVQVDENGVLTDSRRIADPVLEYLSLTGIVKPIAPGAWQLGAKDPTLSLSGLLAASSDFSGDLDTGEIGARGEELSMNYEFQRTGAWPLQVSRISNMFGYDLQSVQDRSRSQSLAVEVKATTTSRLLINWSANEARTASLLKDLYRIHIWGEVDIDRPVKEDFERLTAKGYPRVILNPGVLASSIIAEASSWTALKDSRIVASNFLWEFWPTRV